MADDKSIKEQIAEFAKAAPRFDVTKPHSRKLMVDQFASVLQVIADELEDLNQRLERLEIQE